MTCSFLLSLIPRTTIRHIVGTIFRKVTRKSDKQCQNIGHPTHYARFTYLTNQMPDASAPIKITRNTHYSFVDTTTGLP